MAKIHLVSLGCPKNLTDSEKLLGKLGETGLDYSDDPEESDIILVNTCGFIEDAKRESIDEILKASELKKTGKARKLVVFGCLSKRYGEELKKELPEIDALLGVGEDDEIVRFCAETSGSQPLPRIAKKRRLADSSGLFDTPYAYLKISEGCDRGCTYCVIPRIRGPYVSIAPDKVLAEAEGLIGRGKKELILVAQDITAYGKDMGDYDLRRLVSDIAGLKGDFRVRLLYLYPSGLDDRLLETIAEKERICNYIDMPLQHSERHVLGLMGRGGSRDHFTRLIRRIREIIPDVALRTTFITGFPGETEEDFEGLKKFVRKTKFDRMGVFTYSREEGTAASKLRGHLPARIRTSRRDEIMTLQSSISLEKNLALVGGTFRALIDDSERGTAFARIYSQAPEIDGVVIVKDCSARKGEFIETRITRAFDYDLEGEQVR